LTYLTAVKFGETTTKATYMLYFLLQKKIIRIICNVSYTHHTQELFLELKVLKLVDLLVIDLNISIIIYKDVKNILPTHVHQTLWVKPLCVHVYFNYEIKTLLLFL